MGATTNASSDARFSDVIWFDIPTGSIGEVVPYEIEIDGSVSGSGHATVAWNVNGDRGTYYFGSGDTIRGAFAVSANTASYTMLIDLTGYAGAGSREGADPGVYDVDHTVKFKVLLPDGVAGHSASGLLPFYGHRTGRWLTV